MEKVIFVWSGGKDSAMALYELKKAGSHEVVGLLTCLTKDYDRIAMHGVRRELLEQQAASIGLPLEKLFITKSSTNDEYDQKMKELLTRYQSQGVSGAVFGDIFLEECRNYREKRLGEIGMKGVFPIWKRDTKELAQTFIEVGFKTIITCVDSKVLDKKFAGRHFDREFLAELPANVDPCGENGEFHSFAYDGPIFRKPVPVKTGEVVLRNERFYYCDLMAG